MAGNRGFALILTPDTEETEAPATPTPQPPESDTAQAPYVIIVVEDGARYADTFGDPNYANVPYMWNYLRPQGTLLTNFYNQGLALTDPGHASLVTGTDQHIDNSGILRPDKPTIFEYHRRHDGVGPGDVWVVSGKTKLGILSHSQGEDNLGATADTFDGEDDQVWQEVQRVMDKQQPSIIVINFPSTDKRGHEGDWDGYLGAIRNFDRIANELWNKIQSSSHYRNKTTLIITNDHGRSDRDWRVHGDDTEGSHRIMLLALGPKIREGYISDRERSLIDVVPTIERLIGCPMPDAQGQVMEEVLVNRVPAGLLLP
ncbi:MAG: sulfatase-like hydrolase/transferase [Dehalococcoidia bacterium]|nr:sulfatase-like hydrolase/transferase [Dehalococcoidia bacterium]